MQRKLLLGLFFKQENRAGGKRLLMWDRGSGRGFKVVFHLKKKKLDTPTQSQECHLFYLLFFLVEKKRLSAYIVMLNCRAAMQKVWKVAGLYWYQSCLRQRFCHKQSDFQRLNQFVVCENQVFSNAYCTRPEYMFKCLQDATHPSLFFSSHQNRLVFMIL